MSTTTLAIPATIPKLTWNSPTDAEETFESVMSELKSLLIQESVFHCISATDSFNRLATRPLIAGRGTPAYRKQMESWQKSVRDLNDDANKAVGTLMRLFDPECNAHRSLTAWYAEDVTAGMAARFKPRKDFNFRNAWTNFYSEYQPNKQINLDTILKKWESLTDEDISFAEFQGKYMKFMSEMEDIGQPPTEAKQYEMLRQNVKNPHLQIFVVGLSLPDARRKSLADFFEECIYYVRFNKDKDSGRKRKVEEVFGRSVTVAKEPRDGSRDATCWRCGQPGHLKFNWVTKLSCSSTTCALCRQHIGKDQHDARACSDRSHSVFPAGNQSAKKNKTVKSNDSKKRKPRAKKSSTYVAEEAAQGLPKEVVAALAVLNKFQAGNKSSERKVTFSEDLSA